MENHSDYRVKEAHKEFRMQKSFGGNAILRCFDRLQSAASARERWAVAQGVLAEFGADWITIGSARRSGLRPIEVLSSTSASLMDDYVAADLPRHDRWLSHAAASWVVETTEIGCADGVTSPALIRELHTVLADHGVRRVALVPASTEDRVEAVVLYTRENDGAAALKAACAGGELRVIAALVTRFCATTDRKQSDHERYRFLEALSSREREILRWLSLGMRTEAIADRLGLRCVTVGKHLANARCKLGARTREQALAIALREGLIDV